MSQQIRIAAYGVLVRDAKVLLCRLSSHVSKSAGQWTLPGGGIDFGESPEEAVIREFKEETGLVVTAGSLLAVDSVCDVVAEREHHRIRILYQTHYVKGELSFEQQGTTDLCEWFTELQAKSLPKIALTNLGLKYAFS